MLDRIRMELGLNDKHDDESIPYIHSARRVFINPRTYYVESKEISYYTATKEERIIWIVKAIKELATIRQEAMQQAESLRDTLEALENTGNRAEIDLERYLYVRDNRSTIATEIRACVTAAKEITNMINRTKDILSKYIGRTTPMLTSGNIKFKLNNGTLYIEEDIFGEKRSTVVL